MKTRMVFLSDTHRSHEEWDEFLEKWKGDSTVLVHLGDADCYDQVTWETFRDWLAAWAKKFGKTVFVPGNHDTYIDENFKKCKKELNDLGVDLLVDEGFTYRGLKFYGTPYGSYPMGHGFSLMERDLGKVYEGIPKDVDVLLTHQPPLYTLDGGYGSESLDLSIKKLKSLNLHAFGHVHGHCGYKQEENTLFLNAALLNTFDNGPWEPVVVEVDGFGSKVLHYTLMSVT